MISTILLLYILNALTPLPNWLIILVWVLAIICGISETSDNKH
jgi:hypothetical protein